MGRRSTSGGVEIRDNSIRIDFQWRGKRHKETVMVNGSPLPPTPPNIRYAQRLAAEIRDKVRIGTFSFAEYFPESKQAVKTQAGTVGEFLDVWFKQADLTDSTTTTYRRYKDNFWKPEIGHIALDKLKHSDITTALKKKSGLSGKTRNNYLSMLSAALELAVNDEQIPKNPCSKIKHADWQKADVDPFSQEEAEEILKHLKNKYPEPVWNLFEFWFFTGLRTSELLGLEWSSVDLRSATMVIKQGFVVDTLQKRTKTAKQRSVKLNGRAMAAITRQKAWTYLEGDRVFHDPGTGKPWAYEQNARKRYWLPALKALGIRYRRPYNCRHTYATLGLMAGANPAFMARQLGHGLKVFFDDYADWINGKQDDAEMAKIDGQILGFVPDLSLKPSSTT